MMSSSPSRRQRANKSKDSYRESKSSRAGTSLTSSNRANRSKSSVIATKRSVLFLKQNHVTFETPSQKVSVFFDECNREIICLTGGIPNPTKSAGLKTKVLFQATECSRFSESVEFLLPIEKRILSIKLNSDRTVLAYHVEKSNVEFVNVSRIVEENGVVTYKLSDKKYIQSSKAKNSKLFGFLWTDSMHLVMITDISIEYYQVDSNRGRLKHLKTFQSSTNWFVYQPNNQQVDTNSSEGEISNTDVYSILMISTGSLGNSMQPYMFTKGKVVRLQRFDVEGNWNAHEKVELFEKSITIASIYKKVRLLVLQHESLNIKSRGAQILVYTIDAETGSTVKTHTLDLDINGRFAINILDNMVIAHDQPSKSSFIFDIAIDSTEKSDYSNHYVSLIDSQPVRPLRLVGSRDNIEMYSLNWVFFQPYFIIDAKIGMLSTLHIDLDAMSEVIHDNLLLLNFLAHRNDSEDIILKKSREIVGNCLKASRNESMILGTSLGEVSSTFEILSRLVISAPELEKKPSTIDKHAADNPVIKTEDCDYSAAISQEDLQREVLKQLEFDDFEDHAQLHFVSSSLLELIFLIRKKEKNIHFCIYEQLVKCLVTGGKMYQMIQMIRSHIIKDSKQMACLLLSLRNKFKPAAQLGLDMLQRLDCLPNIIESLSLNSDIQQGDSARHNTIESDSNWSGSYGQNMESMP